MRREICLATALAGGYPLAIARVSPARRCLVSVLRHDDPSAGYSRSGKPRRRNGGSAVFSVVAARAGGLLNVADLSRTVALPQNDVEALLCLAGSDLSCTTISPWAKNIGKRVIQTPKVYVNDSGLLAYFQGVTMDRLKTEASPSLRALLENLL